MPLKKISKEQLLALILDEARKAELEDMPRNVTFFRTEEEDGWTISFDGPLMFSRDAQKFAQILTRLGREYAVVWQTRH